MQSGRTAAAKCACSTTARTAQHSSTNSSSALSRYDSFCFGLLLTHVVRCQACSEAGDTQNPFRERGDLNVSSIDTLSCCGRHALRQESWAAGAP